MGHWFESPFPLVGTPQAALPRGQKPDIFEAVGTEMALAHNMLIRTLNAAYVQAPYVQPADHLYFVQFINCLLVSIDTHHVGEEEVFFPHIEEWSGDKGIMETNVSQHHAFHDGLTEFATYIRAIIAGKETYDGEKIVKMIDAFGPALCQHLADEIPTLVELRKYGEEKMKPLPAALAAEGQRNLGKIGLFEGGCMAFYANDKTYEDGLWTNFPEAVPYPVKFFIENVAYWRHSSWWKFTPCTPAGQPRPAPYAGPPTTTS